MYQVDDGEEGASISGELYQVPIEVLLKVIEEPAGLYRGPVLLADGPGRLDGRRRHGSWRSATSRPTRSRAHRSNRPAGLGRASTTAPRPTRISMRIPVRSVDRWVAVCQYPGYNLARQCSASTTAEHETVTPLTLSSNLPLRPARPLVGLLTLESSMDTSSVHHPTAGTVPKAVNSLKRVVAASMAGTTLEWYDHFIYGSAAALVFPKLFFPQSDPVTATLLSLVTYSVAFVTRPLGAAIFGHFGDKRGRKNVLIVTLVLMGTCTTLIGALPTYDVLGLWAALLLVLLRVVQGIGLGGEWGGAALMVGEHSSGGRRGFLGSLVQIASPLGLLIANGVFSLVTFLVSEQAFFSWGWRVPFLSSALLVGVGLWIRVQVHESPLFEELPADEHAKAPIVEVLTSHWRRVALAVGSRVGSDVTFYVFNILVLVYGTAQLKLERQELLNAVLLGAASQAVSIPLWGYLADRIGRRPVLMMGAVGAGVWVFVFFPLLASGSTPLVFLAPVVGNFFIAAMWGPLAAYVPELFPTKVRYTGAGLGFQMAGVFGGALAPLISIALVARYNSWVPVAVYLCLMLAILIACVFLAPETSDIDLQEAGEDNEQHPVGGRQPEVSSS